MGNELVAPFPWFGGKSKAAPLVWAALGDVDNYVEPFAGSLAVLLGRPSWHTGFMETVNDIDHYIVNFWRALQHDPAGVAHYANNPVNEADLTARHIWLVNTGAERIARLEGDPDYYDVQVAGWWVWGICCWIGGSWCSGEGPWTAVNGRLTRKQAGEAGVKRPRVHLGYGKGVNRRSLHLNANAAGTATGEAEIAQYLAVLAARLRYVCVCCGDWQRVVTRGALNKGKVVGIFLDPPYDPRLRDQELYNMDAPGLSAQVREWCIANQDNPRYRIVLAGYEGEHDLPGWRVVAWRAGASYKTHRGDQNGNRFKERLWLSPHCLDSTPSLLEQSAGDDDEEGEGEA